MRWNRFRGMVFWKAPFLLGFLLVGIAACGGGGGSSPAPSPAPPASPPPPPPSGSVPPPAVPEVRVRLTTGNGRSFGIGAIEAFRTSGAHLLGEPGNVDTFGVFPPNPDTLGQGLWHLKWFVHRAIEAETLRPAEATGWQESFACDRGAWTVSNGFAGAGGTGTLDIDFDRCQHGGIELRGAVSLQIAQRTGGIPDRYTRHHEQLRLEFLPTGHSVLLNGSASIVEDIDADTASERIDATIDDLTRGVRYEIRNLRTAFVRAGPWFSWSATGRNGELGISSQGFAQVEMVESFPLVTGIASSLRLRPGDYVTLHLDADGDGTYEQVARGSQSAWEEGPGAPNEAPQLIVYHAPGSIGLPARLVVSDTVDANFDFMRWQYLLVDQPAGSAPVINFDVEAGLLLIEADTPGDYSVRLTVTDHQGLAAAETVVARIRFDRLQVDYFAPESLAEGESLRVLFHSVNDRAGPLSYVIRGGMPGMALTSDGVLTWDPSIFPTFGTSVIRLQIEVSNPDYSTIIHLPIEMMDTHSRLPKAYLGLQPPGWASSMQEYRQRDGATPELLLGTLRGVAQRIAWTGTTFRPSWTYPVAFGGGVVEVKGHDIDGDGEREVIVHAGTQVHVLDGRSGRHKATSGTFLFGIAAPIHAGDFDGDGSPELALAVRSSLNPTSFDVRVLRWPDMFELRQLRPPPGAGYLELARLAPSAPFSLVMSPGRIYDAATYLQHPAPPVLPRRFALGNVDGDPALEMVALTDTAVHVFDGVTMQLEHTIPLGFAADFVSLTSSPDPARKHIVVGGRGSPLLIFDPPSTTAAPVRSIALPITEPGRQEVAVGAFTASGTEQIFWSFTHDSEHGDALALLDPASGAKIWQSVSGDIPLGPYWGGAPDAAGSNEHLFLGRIDAQGRHDWIWLNARSGASRRARAFDAESVAAVEQFDWDADGDTETFVHVALNGGAASQVSRYGHEGGLEGTFAARPGLPGPIRAVTLAGGLQTRIVANVGGGLLLLDPLSGAAVASVTLAHHCDSGVVHDLAQSPTTGLLYVTCDQSLLAYEVRSSALLLRHSRSESFSARRAPIALISDPRDGTERVAVVYQFEFGSRRLEVMTADLAERLAAPPMQDPIAAGELVSMIALPGGGVLLAQGSPARQRETRLVLFDPFGVADQQTWRSPPLPGWVTPGSLRADALAGGAYRVALATNAAAFVTP